MSEDSSIFGGRENLKKGIGRVIEKFSPDVVGVMTTGLTEAMGATSEDVGWLSRHA